MKIPLPRRRLSNSVYHRHRPGSFFKTKEGQYPSSRKLTERNTDMMRIHYRNLNTICGRGCGKDDLPEGGKPERELLSHDIECGDLSLSCASRLGAKLLNPRILS